MIKEGVKAEHMLHDEIGIKQCACLFKIIER